MQLYLLDASNISSSLTKARNIPDLVVWGLQKGLPLNMPFIFNIIQFYCKIKLHIRHHQGESADSGFHSQFRNPCTSLFPADLTFYDLMVVWLPHPSLSLSSRGLLVMANILTTSQCICGPGTGHRLDKAVCWCRLS